MRAYLKYTYDFHFIRLTLKANVFSFNSHKTLPQRCALYVTTRTFVIIKLIKDTRLILYDFYYIWHD